MRKNILVLILFGLSVPLFAQDVGLSFSYFIPRNGYFSTPVSPFSIRGLGFNINRFLAVQTGASLYRMSGLSVKDIPLPIQRSPFKTSRALDTMEGLN